MGQALHAFRVKFSDRRGWECTASTWPSALQCIWPQIGEKNRKEPGTSSCFPMGLWAKGSSCVEACGHATHQEGASRARLRVHACPG